MKKQLLKRYYAFTVTVMMFSASANAQIVYTDVIPDSTMFCGGAICAENYNLDLNNDGNNDFTLTASASATNTNPTHYGKRVIASPLNGNAVKDILVNSNTVSIPLQFNAVIDSNLLLNQSWQSSGWNILKDTAWFSFGGPGGSGYGLWNNLSEYYLGLRLLQSGQTYYGWVRLRVDVTSSFASLIVMDYAYNSIANQPILAGQTQNVNIPDAIFKTRLVENPAINTNGDGEIQVTEAAAYNGVMDVRTFLGPFIWDLTGIEAFTALTGLDCSYNSISSLNLFANTALTRLNCYNNSLTSLDVSANTELTYLNCKGWTASTNSLTSLDLSANTVLDTLICYTNALTSLNLSANTALTYIQCNDNALSSLDLSTNTALTYLDCSGNLLTGLDVSADTALATLVCPYNELVSLNVSNNAALSYLEFSSNSLTAIDLSANTALSDLYCNTNSLTGLDLYANTALSSLDCSSNSLISLNIQNGNNANLALLAEDNSALTCIQVDDVANANSYTGVTFFKDDAASYSTNCLETSTPEIGNLDDVQIFPNPSDHHITIDLGSNHKKVQVTIADIAGKVMYTTIATGTQKVEVNTHDFAEGIYVVQIQTADSMGTKMLVVKK